MRIYVLRAVLLGFLAIDAFGAHRYVNVNSATPVPPYLSWDTAATNIQDAIDVAADGDTVLVTNGVYAAGGKVVYYFHTNRVAMVRPLMVRSVNGPQHTIIQGYQMPGTFVGSNAVRCVYMTNGAVLSGFTLTNGAARDAYAYDFQQSGGGVWCESTDAVVTNCVLVGNWTLGDGGGAYRGTLIDCLLANNSGVCGGGAAFGALYNCALQSNSASIYGGGASACMLTSCTLIGNTNSSYVGGGALGGTLTNCTLTGNVAVYGAGAGLAILDRCLISGNIARGSGGGVFQGEVNRTILKDNVASFGGGAYETVLRSCALTGNIATNEAGGAYDSHLTNCTLTANASPSCGGTFSGTLMHCILYYNYADDGADNYLLSAMNYCCTTPMPVSGTGNLSSAPGLVSGVHLAADSPCRGAGNVLYSAGTDLDGESWAVPPAIGCDEYSSDAVSGPLTATIRADYTNVALEFDVNLAADVIGHVTSNVWTFGDGTCVNDRAYVSHGWAAPGDYPVVCTVYNDSHPGGIPASCVIHVTEERHYVSASGTSPLPPYSSWNTATTNIQSAVDAATLPGALILVTNGVYRFGGMWADGSNRVAVLKPIVVQSVNGPLTTHIRGQEDPARVRCVYLTNGARLIGFTLTNGCVADTRGGGGVLGKSLHALVSDCIIRSNWSWSYGGGAAGASFENCLIHSNAAINYGGGGYNGVFNRCSFRGNRAERGGGGSFKSVLKNCLLGENATISKGGGSHDDLVNNCTVSGNTASTGGGVYNSTVRNSIVYYNAATTSNNYAGGSLSYSCSAPLPPGTGNVSGPPYFVDQFSNWRLQTNSPCINAGNNSDTAITTDLDHRPRIVGGFVDIGAFEFQGPGMSQFIAWLQEHGFPTDGSEDFADADGDKHNNWQEWRAKTDPFNNLSVLQMLSASNSVEGVVLRWKSVSGVTYYLQRATDLTAQAPFSTVQSNIAGQDGTTSHTNTSGVPNGFYRVGVQ